MSTPYAIPTATSAAFAAAGAALTAAFTGRVISSHSAAIAALVRASADFAEAVAEDDADAYFFSF